VIVFDWDDTLFPTSYVNDDLQLEWSLPLHKQPVLDAKGAREAQKRLQRCERNAMRLLNKAHDLANVVVVTLASAGWVDTATRFLYPDMGRLLRDLDVPVVYAQERAGVTEQQHEKLQYQSSDEVERFWGLVKGRAISEEVEKFYSQYEGQSWKNILSIGDSSFERYGLLAATSAYMQGLELSEAEGWHPNQEGCWQKVQDGHVMKLRAKCCKLVDQPDATELAVELGWVVKWLAGMVNLDDGFDLDLEYVNEEEEVAMIDAVLRGELPVSKLPHFPG